MRVCLRCGASFRVPPSWLKTQVCVLYCTITCKKQTTAERNQEPLTADVLRRYLDYNPETGEFTWRISPVDRIPAGAVAGYPDGKKGYMLVTVRGHEYFAHRLAWLYVTGEWPKDQIDHINHQKADNRSCNLREATNAQNQVNRPRHTFKSKSGAPVKRPYRGVQEKPCGSYEAHLGRRYLGSFRTAEQASDAYWEEAEKVFGDYITKT
jgi:hypothetical protein